MTVVFIVTPAAFSLIPQGIGPRRCQEETGSGQRLDVHFQGALMKVGIQCLVDITFDNTIGSHKVRQGSIPISVFLLAGRHGWVNANVRFIIVRLSTISQKFENARNGLAPIMLLNGIGHGNGAGIDKGIARPTLFAFQLHNTVKGRTARFPSHALPQIFPLQVQSHDEGKDFGNGLNGKGRFGAVARRVGGTRQVGKGHAKLIGCHLRQRGNVRGDLALVQVGLNIRGNAIENVLPGDFFKRAKARHSQ